MDDIQHAKKFFKPHLSMLKDLSTDQNNILVHGQDSVHNRIGRQNFDNDLEISSLDRYPRIAKSDYECNAKAFGVF
ncbi:MAG TPA: hypothetical protein VFI70_11255 [Nitrososphaeraceae archaeon]|nr:hypothetical protein [Nitrososphaeraceae archaeon]